MSTSLTITDNTALAMAGEAEATEQGASHMAAEFEDATQIIVDALRTIEAQANRLREAFDPDGKSHWYFTPSLHYDGSNWNAERADELVKNLGRRAWRILLDRLGVKNVMSVAKRAKFEQQLERGELPPISAEAIMGVIAGLATDAKEFAREAAKEVFDNLTPKSHWGGKYKTNSSFRIGRKVILPHRVERCWDGKKFRPNYHRQQELTAMDGVFHLLDGEGIMREHTGPLCKAIEASEDGRGETAYFAFKCFKNGNLHLTMKRLDLVKELNGLAAGEYVLGEDME